MIRVSWDILEQEGRVLKLLLTLAKHNAVFVPSDRAEKGAVQLQIGNILDLQRNFKDRTEISKLFGQTPDKRKSVESFLQYYEKDLKPLSRLSGVILKSGGTLAVQEIRAKKKNIQKAIEAVGAMLQTNRSRYILGSQMSIADIVLYFDLCNIAYFGRNFSHYPKISKWFLRIYSMREVKSITHQWFSMAKEIARSLRKPTPLL